MASKRGRTCFASGWQQTLAVISQLRGASLGWRQWSRRLGYLRKVSKAWALEARSPAAEEGSSRENCLRKERDSGFYETGQGEIN